MNNKIFNFLYQIIFGLIHMFLFLIGFIIPYFMSFIKDLKKHTQVNLDKILLYSSSFVGILLTYIMSFGGGSEMYFILSVLFIIELISISFFFNQTNILNKNYKKIIYVCLIISCLSGIGCYGSFIKHGAANVLRSLKIIEKITKLIQ